MAAMSLMNHRRVELLEGRTDLLSLSRDGLPLLMRECHSKHLARLIASLPSSRGARCSSVVRAFAHGAMGRRIDPSWDGPIQLFLVSASSPRLV